MSGDRDGGLCPAGSGGAGRGEAGARRAVPGPLREGPGSPRCEAGAHLEGPGRLREGPGPARRDARSPPDAFPLS